MADYLDKSLLSCWASQTSEQTNHPRAEACSLTAEVPNGICPLLCPQASRWHCGEQWRAHIRSLFEGLSLCYSLRSEGRPTRISAEHGPTAQPDAVQGQGTPSVILTPARSYETAIFRDKNSILLEFYSKVDGQVVKASVMSVYLF